MFMTSNSCFIDTIGRSLPTNHKLPGLINQSRGSRDNLKPHLKSCFKSHLKKFEIKYYMHFINGIA